MKKWNRINRKKIFSHPRIEIWEDEVELPSGHRTSYIHYGDSKGSCTIIAVNSKNQLLVQKEYSYPPNEWLYQFPGGGVEKAETPLEAASRELKEEGGLTGELQEIGWYYRDNRRSAGKMYVYTAKNLQPATLEKDIEEAFESYWLNEDEIISLIQRGEFTNYSALAAWSLYSTRKQR